MAKFKSNPDTCSKHFAIPANWCECLETFDCAYSVAGELAAFEFVEVNGKKVAIAASATNDELVTNVITALVEGGMTDYNSSNISYDGSTFYFGETSMLEPLFTIAGVETKVTALCIEVEYCEYEYNSTDVLVVTIDGEAATLDTEYTHVDGTYTVTAPNGSTVLIGDEPVEACRCGIIVFEGEETKK